MLRGEFVDEQAGQYAAELASLLGNGLSIAKLEDKLRATYAAAVALEEIAIRKGITINEPFQGAQIGAFTVLAPSRQRFLDLVVEVERGASTNEASRLSRITEGVVHAVRSVAAYVSSIWGQEIFPDDTTSARNEMSVIQFAKLGSSRILLTGDAGRSALEEAVNFSPRVSLRLPGIDCFQVPHHGARRNVSTDLLDSILGERLSEMPPQPDWCAVCSSAKEDEDHPRKAVIRAILHRGGHWTATEGNSVRFAEGIQRQGWGPLPQAKYPHEQEE